MKTVYTVYKLHDALLLSRPSSFTVRNFLLALLQVQDYVLSWVGLGGMDLSTDCISNQSAAEALSTDVLPRQIGPEDFKGKCSFWW